LKPNGFHHARQGALRGQRIRITKLVILVAECAHLSHTHPVEWARIRQAGAVTAAE